MSLPSDEISVRRQKRAALRESGAGPYRDRFETTHSLAAAAELPDSPALIRVAGRVVALRSFGKLTFGHLQDADGRFQFAARQDVLGEGYAEMKKTVDIGDYLGVVGPVFTTKTGEKTVQMDEWQLLSKAIRPLPDKFHGVADIELLRRKRYLELISDREAVERFRVRHRFIQLVRTYLSDHEFVEIDTPVLTNKASGALATPFVTHYEALSTDVYLRIAPETYLKRAVAAGFNRVFEVARCFRNEGIDPSHLPDFTMVEFYAAYWNYLDNMAFTETMIRTLVKRITGGSSIRWGDTEIETGEPWPRYSFRDLILRDSGIDIAALDTREALVSELRTRRLLLDDEPVLVDASFGSLVDALYKKVSRPKLVNPAFVLAHPTEISPLARRNDANPGIVDRFQLVINGWEVVNAYSELVDPVDQRERFETQAAARAAGDREAMELDEEFLECMEHGMPPMSGWGMGVDRFVSLLTNCENLRDVVLFPLLRPTSE